MEKNTKLEQLEDGCVRWPSRESEPWEWEVEWDNFMERRKSIYGKMNLAELTCRQAFKAGFEAGKK